MATIEEKKKLREWQEYLADIRNATPVEINLTEAEKKKKLAYLEANPERWIKYFFPKYAKYPFAKFQQKAIKRILKNNEWYEVLSWSRECAKSTIVMFCVLYLALTRRKRNVILASATEDSAKKLLQPYRANLEANGRIKVFYGEQINLGNWTDKLFIAKCGCSFYAVGAGNAPRGSRNEEVRPDVLLFDDFDTDEDCRNPDTINKKWEWLEQAFFGTRSVSEPTLIIGCGNIIAKDCCIVRAGKMADHHDVINIVDADGNSTWPEKNTQENIDRIRRTISKASFQKEYMNNPVSEGKIFKNLVAGKVPPLKKFKFVIVYGDPAYSNNRNKAASTKAMCLIGKIKQTYYVIKAFVGRVTNAQFIEWYYLMHDFVGSQTALYIYQENNSLQDPFFQQVFKPLVRAENEKRNMHLHITGDDRNKIDKATRIEANLEPLDRNSLIVFNESELNNPHMIELLDQFKLFEMTLPYPADGPDCVEGCIRKIDDKYMMSAPIDTISRDELRHRDL